MLSRPDLARVVAVNDDSVRHHAVTGLDLHNNAAQVSIAMIERLNAG